MAEQMKADAAKRTEHTLKKDGLRQGGVARKKGEKVSLRPDQAERCRKLGLID